MTTAGLGRGKLVSRLQVLISEPLAAAAYEREEQYGIFVIVFWRISILELFAIWSISMCLIPSFSWDVALTTAEGTLLPWEEIHSLKMLAAKFIAPKEISFDSCVPDSTTSALELFL
jgi:hypothetical protein